jgi:hypothetical protein
MVPELRLSRSTPSISGTVIQELATKTRRLLSGKRIAVGMRLSASISAIPASFPRWCLTGRAEYPAFSEHLIAVT